MSKEKRNKDGLTETEFLAKYQPGDYERPSVTVDMMVLGMNEDLDGLKLLLIQRKNHPYMDSWALAGGFVDITESAYTAACRELEEETGLTDVYLEQLYTMSQPDRDPRMRVIDIAYIALMPVADLKAGDDAKEALWFDLHFSEEELVLTNQEKQIEIRYELRKQIFENGRIKIQNLIPVEKSQETLAFDHAEIVVEGMMRLRNKVEYSDIAFNLVPEEFTLPDLQRVYEILLGKTLYKANFRDKIAGKIKQLDKKGNSIIGKRRSNLYVYEGIQSQG